ncbi:MAG: hypothetical protein GTO45_02445 [Candidatus Aminicenantes bacterium]|nr:hypothetical protein [Candidatus Aminicenantes bacterium]NIM77589.1 hypothetical protein [Candidatus Aminicenantes bacterium]NIN16903.1 hypothetical protein [Candidatus Aminicenantes bacterium]NIN40796.1 hypothetical protein [Candidatus Aminicenantes bacterium]NIN83600.1 hypothetical protein [Candidatus Aminicenantes bacterium]
MTIPDKLSFHSWGPYIFIALTVIFFNLIAIFGYDVLLHDDPLWYTYVLPIIKAAHRFGLSLDFTRPSHIHDLGPGFWNNAILKLGIKGNFAIKAQPSLVETTFRESVPKATLAYLLKFAWRFFPQSYKYVGGWEIFIKKKKGNLIFP